MIILLTIFKDYKFIMSNLNPITTSTTIGRASNSDKKIPLSSISLKTESQVAKSRFISMANTSSQLALSDSKKSYTVRNGLILSKNIINKTYNSIEHGNIKSVNAIVLHRTDSSTAKSTLASYHKGQKTGAHFLIDKEGKIYQTASMIKSCWHVGNIRSRCTEETACSTKETKKVKALLFQKNLGYGKRISNLSKYEATKSYPERYPKNSDSIGIEVVGLYNKKSNAFSQPTSQQKNALNWLLDTLSEVHGLNKETDLFAHGTIAYKQVSEGKALMSSIKPE